MNLACWYTVVAVLHAGPQLYSAAAVHAAVVPASAPVAADQAGRRAGGACRPAAR